MLIKVLTTRLPILQAPHRTTLEIYNVKKPTTKFVRPDMKKQQLIKPPENPLRKSGLAMQCIFPSFVVEIASSFITIWPKFCSKKQYFELRSASTSYVFSLNLLLHDMHLYFSHMYEHRHSYCLEKPCSVMIALNNYRVTEPYSLVYSVILYKQFCFTAKVKL